MTTPAFSVIVPAYNAARTVPDTLASIGAQTFVDHEVIVVDDGSTDDTGEIVERLLAPARGRVLHQANRGLPAARNAGIAAARGRWIALLDADDLWMPGYLARMRHLLEHGGDDDELGLAYCDAWIYDDRRRRIARRSAFEWYRPAVVPRDPRAFYLALLRENFIWVSACVPRTVFHAVGGFDERLRAAEDWNLWLRIMATGRRAMGTTELLGVYRHTAGQMHADPHRMLTGQRDAMHSVVERAPLDDELRAATLARAAQIEAVLAGGVVAPVWRRGLRALIAPTRGVKDFRVRTPPVVARALPHLFESG